MKWLLSTSIRTRSSFHQRMLTEALSHLCLIRINHLTWLHTLSDIAYSIHQLSQTKASEAEENDFKRLEIIFSAYRRKFWATSWKREYFYSRSTFFRRHIGRYERKAVWIAGRYRTSCWLWSELIFHNRSSAKYELVTHSVLASELYDISNDFDVWLAADHTFSLIIVGNVKQSLITESRTLFDSIVSFCSMTEYYF